MKIAEGYSCTPSNGMVYTVDSSKGCFGWSRATLQECQDYCSKNALPPGCQSMNRSCKWMIWYDFGDGKGLCNLASKCEFEEEGDSMFSVWMKESGNFFWIKFDLIERIESCKTFHFLFEHGGRHNSPLRNFSSNIWGFF